MATCDHSSCAVFQRDSGVAFERWAPKSPKQKIVRTKQRCVLVSPGLNRSATTLILTTNLQRQSKWFGVTKRVFCQRNSVVDSCLGLRPLALGHHLKVQGCGVCHICSTLCRVGSPLRQWQHGPHGTLLSHRGQHSTGARPWATARSRAHICIEGSTSSPRPPCNPYDAIAGIGLDLTCPEGSLVSLRLRLPRCHVPGCHPAQGTMQIPVSQH